MNPSDVAARCNPLALKQACSKDGWYATEEIAKRELRHIQQYRKGPASNYFPKRVYYCTLHGVWHLTSSPVKFE